MPDNLKAPSASRNEPLRARPHGRSAWDGALRKFRPVVLLATFALVAAVLYWARAVLMPIALSVLLTFLLAPLVSFLQRKHLGRIVSVTLVVLLVFSVLGGIAWAIATQVTALGNELPNYRHNLRQKVADLRGASKGGAIEKVQSTAQEVVEEIQKEEKPAKPAEKPVPVVVRSEPTGLWQLPTLLETAASTGLVVLLVIYLLIERTELRNRLIRLVGYGKLAITTKALDEAAWRISRYLLMQSLINASFGAGVAAGLFFIGVPYAVLWGFLAAVLRFIPYVGPWLGAVLPITLSLAVFSGWPQPLMVIGVFLVLELFSNMVMEPMLYGQSAGVSQVALLIAIAFWTWLWGPIGLVLATPLTVCIVVLGKYVPELEFIAVLMGDQPVMETEVSYYQRLLAADQAEAREIVEKYVKQHSLESVYDEVLVPALTAAKRDREREALIAEEEQFVFRATREIVEDLAVPPAGGAPVGVARASAEDTPRRGRVLAVPAHDAADELALVMLRQLVAARSHEVEIVSATMLSSEVIARVAELDSPLVCVGAVSPGGIAQVRYLCKRLRQRFPDIRIAVGRWGDRQEAEESRAVLLAAGADQVGATLLETRDQLLEAIPLVSPAVRDSADAPAPSVLVGSPARAH